MKNNNDEVTPETSTLSFFQSEEWKEISIDLIKTYIGEDRHYHGLFHIMDTLVIAESLKPDNELAVYLTMWFHDVVYDATKSDNEELSAAFAKEKLSGKVDESVVDFVVNAILLTKHKEVDHRTASTKGKDYQIVLDSDLFGLATSKYKENSEKIRKEYSHVSNEDWKKGRSQFLKSMLEREKIYHLLDSKFEELAKKNMREELESLS